MQTKKRKRKNVDRKKRSMDNLLPKNTVEAPSIFRKKVQGKKRTITDKVKFQVVVLCNHGLLSTTKVGNMLGFDTKKIRD